MARITIEDCLKQVNNRFDLVLVAAQRARQLARGDEDPRITVEKGESPAVTALRELAQNTITPDEILEQQNRSDLRFGQQQQPAGNAEGVDKGGAGFNQL